MQIQHSIQQYNCSISLCNDNNDIYLKLYYILWIQTRSHNWFVSFRIFGPTLAIAFYDGTLHKNTLCHYKVTNNKLFFPRLLLATMGRDETANVHKVINNGCCCFLALSFYLHSWGEWIQSSLTPFHFYMYFGAQIAKNTWSDHMETKSFPLKPLTTAIWLLPQWPKPGLGPPG